MQRKSSEILTLILMRHGETSWNRSQRIMGAADIALNTDGREQCIAAAEVLAALGIDKIVSSPQRRALESATIVASQLGMGVETADGLEEVHFGDWQGRTYAEVAEDPRYAAYAASPLTQATPGGETLVDVQSRGLAVLKSLAGGQTVLCVSHGDILRSILCSLMGIPLTAYRQLRVDNCGLSAFAIDGDRVEAKFVNYLADPARAWAATHWSAPA
ncbi:MAG: broad specificity phosphatase PhoE [Hyphomicrobiaceae bacterium]|jgi:broad specificity phosphatase PhoE